MAQWKRRAPLLTIATAAIAAWSAGAGAALLPGSVPAGGTKLPDIVPIQENGNEDHNEYNFRFPLVGAVTPGDLVLCENSGNACDATSQDNWSDLIRFRADPDHPGKSIAVLYSAPEPESQVKSFFLFVLIPPDPNNPKDDPFRGELLNAAFRNEPGGNTETPGDTFLWTPGGGNGYTIVSDPVPEPSSLLILAGGLAAASLCSRMRRRP